MTKQEWYEKDVDKLLDVVNSSRKLRLIALACCRSVEYLNRNIKNCLDKLELFIDNKIQEIELDLAKQDVWDLSVNVDDHPLVSAFSYASCYKACCSSFRAAFNAAVEVRNIKNEEKYKQVEIIKDIYNPNLLTLKFSEQAVSLAEQVYDGDCTARLVLSDYLEENNYPEELYLHLKQLNHYKGCWVIDQILGKS